MKSIRDYLFEIFLALISLCLVVLLVLPYWFGYQMQSSYEDLIQSFADNTDYVYEAVNYDKGWFSSNADVLVKNKEKQPLFYFRHQIIHGPIYLGLLIKGRSPLVKMVIKGQVVAVPGAENLFSDVFGGEEALKVYAAVKMNNNADVAISIPEINKPIRQGKYKIRNAQVNLDYIAEASRYSGEIKIDELFIQSELTLELSQLILNFDQQISNDQFSGDFVLSVDSLKTKLNDHIIGFKQFSSRIKDRKGANVLDLDIDLNASTINAFNEQINSLSLGLTFNSIYYNLFIEQLDKILTDDVQYNALDPHFFAGLQLNPFNFFTDHGTFNSDLVLKVRTNPESLDFHHRYETKLNINVSDVLFKRIYEIIVSNTGLTVNSANDFSKNLISHNYIERNVNKYLVRLESKDGKYLINDLLISYSEFDKTFLQSVFPQ